MLKSKAGQHPAFGKLLWFNFFYSYSFYKVIVCWVKRTQQCPLKGRVHLKRRGCRTIPSNQKYCNF